eukprot:m.184959 g.184959  ORF g.184959 m.184959 type:complete len:74 (+) comp16677_c6_seq3:976-1197(+)
MTLLLLRLIVLTAFLPLATSSLTSSILSTSAATFSSNFEELQQLVHNAAKNHFLEDITTQQIVVTDDILRSFG